MLLQSIDYIMLRLLVSTDCVYAVADFSRLLIPKKENLKRDDEVFNSMMLISQAQIIYGGCVMDERNTAQFSLEIV